jgi:hypothetical protein
MADLDALVKSARSATIRRDVAMGYVRELDRWIGRIPTQRVWPIWTAGFALAAAAIVTVVLVRPGTAPPETQVTDRVTVITLPGEPPPPPPAVPASSAPPPPVPMPRPAPSVAPHEQPVPALAVPVELSIKDRWRDARLLRGQGRFSDAVRACLAIADAADATWSPIALVEAVRIEVGPLADPERAIELAERMLRDWPRDALISEARSLRCQALGQLGRASDCKQP